MAGMHIDGRPGWASWGTGFLTYLFLFAEMPSPWSKCSAKLWNGERKTLVAGFLLTLIGSTCSKYCWFVFFFSWCLFWNTEPSLCRVERDRLQSQGNMGSLQYTQNCEAYIPLWIWSWNSQVLVLHCNTPVHMTWYGHEGGSLSEHHPFENSFQT